MSVLRERLSKKKKPGLGPEVPTQAWRMKERNLK
jgi:hypothetical protein